MFLAQAPKVRLGWPVCAVDPCLLWQTGDLLWEVPEYDQRCFSLHNNKAYIGNGDGTVMCINAKTGAVKYVPVWGP